MPPSCPTAPSPPAPSRWGSGGCLAERSGSPTVGAEAPSPEGVPDEQPPSAKLKGKMQSR